jgi:hypothetical protein
MYSPADARPIFLTISGGNNGSVQLEMSSQLASGGELRVWESTRYGASPTDAVGPYTDDGKVTGSLAVWHAAHTATLTLLHAWIGQTLVVISGPIGTDELLRVADSLRRTRPSSLML